MDIFFCTFEMQFFLFVVALSDLAHAMKISFHLPSKAANSIRKSFLEYE